MSDDVEITRVSYGRTDTVSMVHGMEIVFDTLPSAWEGRDEVEIAFADGSKLTLAAEPEYGPNVFTWKRARSTFWHVRLEPMRPNVLRLQLEDHQHDLLLRDL